MNREVKQNHPNPWILMSHIKKQIKLADTDLVKAENGLSKPKRRNLYKKMAVRRHNLKKNYLKSKNIATFLHAMGSNLMASKLAAGRVDDIAESQNPNLDENIDNSAWKNIEDDSFDILENVNNPYKDRQIGASQKKALKAVKSKCPVCSKGFNSRSNFITCHLCDKDTHTKCINTTFNENHFICNHCTTNVAPDCDTVREDANGCI